MINGEITVIGCGLCRNHLSAIHAQTVERADVIAGGRRLLDWFPSFRGRKVVLKSRVRETVRQLAQDAEQERVVILASGDGLFFGIGHTLLEELPSDRLTFLPNVTAAQEALARLKMPWGSGTRFFSVHGRNEEQLPWRQMLQAPVAVVYCDPKQDPATVCNQLIDAWPPAAHMNGVVAENLKTSNEQVVTGTLRELARGTFAGHSVLIIRRRHCLWGFQTKPIFMKTE